MTAAVRLCRNVSFLRSALWNRDRFCFSAHPLVARRGSFFFHELRFLRAHGVHIIPSLDAYIAP